MKTWITNYIQLTEYMNSHFEALWWFVLIQQPFVSTEDFLSSERCISLISPNMLCTFPWQWQELQMLSLQQVVQGFTEDMERLVDSAVGAANGGG